MTKHAKLSPSASKRWMNCPGSVRLIEDIDIVESYNYYAAEGTAAHELGERCLLNNTNPEDYRGEEINGFEVNDDMIDAVTVYVDFVRGCINNYKGETKLEVEVKCSLKSLRIPGLDGGTSDTVIHYGTEAIHVIDYKHGKGVPVDVEENPQLMQYGLGAYLRSSRRKIKELPNIILTIVQPRAYHEEGVIRSWEISGEDLLCWRDDELIPAAKATLEEDAELVPGDSQCRFCAAKGQCQALFDVTEKQMLANMEKDLFPDPRVMTPEQIITVMDHAEMIRSFITAVENEAKIQMDNGVKNYQDKYKLVRKTTHRKLKTDAESNLLFYLDDKDLYEKKLRSLGNIQKSLIRELGKEDANIVMEEVAYKPEGDIVIAPISDRRKAVLPSINDEAFNDLDESEM